MSIKVRIIQPTSYFKQLRNCQFFLKVICSCLKCKTQLKSVSSFYRLNFPFSKYRNTFVPKVEHGLEVKMQKAIDILEKNGDQSLIKFLQKRKWQPRIHYDTDTIIHLRIYWRSIRKAIA